MIVAGQLLIDEMAKHPLRKLMRKTGMSQHMLEDRR